MSKDWKDSLRNREVPHDEPVFRHELSMVPVSSIAQQFYCEQKVDLKYTLGEVPSAIKDIGTDLHEEILAMEPVKREDLIEHIEKAPRVTATFTLFAEVGKLRVVGQPDAVVFEKSLPKWLIELKTTRGDHTRLWRDQALQVRIYGLLLQRMGFDCSKLNLVLIRMQQEGDLDPSDKAALLTLVEVALKKEQTRELEVEYNLKFFVLSHVVQEAEEALTWAQDYWLKGREPIPTKMVGKCRVCEYNDKCSHTLYKPR